MTVELDEKDLPAAIQWLQQNVGTGNVHYYQECLLVQPGAPDWYGFDWYYVRKESQITLDDHNRRMYTNTITVHDPDLSLMFSLVFPGQRR